MSERYGLFHQPKNTMPKIEHLWVFVSVDPVDGNEGVVAAELAGMMVPMIAADEDRLRILKPMAEGMAVWTTNPIKLVKFTVREEVETYGG